MGVIPTSEVGQMQLKERNFQHDSVQQFYVTLLHHNTETRYTASK